MRRTISVNKVTYLIRGPKSANQLREQYQTFIGKYGNQLSFGRWLVERGKVYVKISVRRNSMRKNMLTIYVGEERGGRFKFTTDKDTLSPQIIRFSERVFPNMEAVKTEAAKLEDRGFKVCIDTQDCFYESPAEPKTVWVAVMEKSGKVVKLPAKLRDFRGELNLVQKISRLPGGASEGRVQVSEIGGGAIQEFYPSVFGLKIVPKKGHRRRWSWFAPGTKVSLQCQRGLSRQDGSKRG